VKRVLLTAVLIMLVLPGCNRTDRVVDNGTVMYVGLEGGFFGITDDHDRRWDPSNLPAEFQTDGLRVRFEGVITDRATVHMWGRTIELTAIKRLN